MSFQHEQLSSWAAGLLVIRESVDSLCRDGADAQYMQYLRPLQVVVWFLVNRPHQILDFSYFTIFGSAHAQKSKLSVYCVHRSRRDRWVVSSAHFVPQAIVKLSLVILYLFLGSFSLGQSSAVRDPQSTEGELNARPLRTWGKCHLWYHFIW